MHAQANRERVPPSPTPSHCTPTHTQPPWPQQSTSTSQSLPNKIVLHRTCTSNRPSYACTYRPRINSNSSTTLHPFSFSPESPIPYSRTLYSPLTFSWQKPILIVVSSTGMTHPFLFFPLPFPLLGRHYMLVM